MLLGVLECLRREGFQTGAVLQRADLVLRDASIGCLAGALLLRWFWATLAKAFADTVNAKRAADAAAAASAAATASATSKPRK